MPLHQRQSANHSPSTEGQVPIHSAPHMWKRSSWEALKVANFQDTGLYGKGYCIIKRLMSFTRQMPQMPGRDSNRGSEWWKRHVQGIAPILQCQEWSGDALRMVITAAEDMLSQCAVEPGWRLGSDLPFTSSPGLSGWRMHLSAWRSLKILPKPAGSVFLKRGATDYLFQPMVLRKYILGKLNTVAHSWLFMKLISTGKALGNAL